MQARDPEYDRFGPWIIEISDDDPPPPLFVPFLDRTEDPLFSLKIPRHIERRRAHPGMDLYDYVVNLYEQDLQILKRVEHGVEARTVQYHEIRSLRVRENLLLGSLHLALPDGAYDLPYNTVSSTLVAHLVDLVRDRYLPASASSARRVTAQPTPPVLSFHFERLLEAEAGRSPEMLLLAAQPEIELGERERSRLRRVLSGLVRKRLLEALHMSDGRELKIISRGPTYAYRWQAVYGTEVCFTPTTAVTAAHWDDVDDVDAIVNLRLQTAGGETSYAFAADNPGLPGYRAELERIVAAATG